MPIHLDDLDVMSEVEGLRSVLIVPCNLCPGVTVAVRQGRPFMRLTRSLLRSAPFEEYLESLRSRLQDVGVKAEIFRSTLYHQWFMCMWTDGRRNQLEKAVRGYDGVIVLGCDSATETVRRAVGSTPCRVIEGMRVAGIMNAKLTFRLPDRLSFKDCQVCAIYKSLAKDAVSV
jgi:hypothetical protein